MKNLPTTIRYMLVLLLMTGGLAAQTAISFNGNVSLSYSNGPDQTFQVAVSGIETVTRNTNGDIIGADFSGLVKVGGWDFPLPNKPARMLAVGGTRWYTYHVQKGDMTFDVTILTGHSRAPKFMRMRATDARTPDIGFGTVNLL